MQRDVECKSEQTKGGPTDISHSCMEAVEEWERLKAELPTALHRLLTVADDGVLRTGEFVEV